MSDAVCYATDPLLTELFADLASSLNDETFFSGLRLDLIESPLPFPLFSARLINCLRNNDIETIGQLLNAVFEKRSFKNMGSGTQLELQRFLEAAASQTGATYFWQVELPEYLDCVPSNDTLVVDDRGVPYLPGALETITEFLFDTSKNRWYDVLARRIGLNGNRFYTLEELAFLYDLSRERVRQIEQHAMNCFANFITKGWTKKAGKSLHPSVSEEAVTLANLVRAKGLLVSHVQLLALLDKRYRLNNATQNQTSLIFFCLEILGITQIKFASNSPGTQTVWLTNASYREAVLLAEKHIALLFKAQVLPICLDEVVIYINKQLRPQNKKVSSLVVEEALTLCNVAEPCGPKSYHTAFARLPGNAHRVHWVLYEKGEPMATHEFVKEINHRLALVRKQTPVTETTAVNPLAAYEFVVTQGRSRWMLKEWGGETRTIVQIMEAFFHSHNRPASPEEIFEYVKARRPVKLTSITIYLSMNQTFRRVGSQEYALSSWRHAEYAQKIIRPRVSQAQFDRAIQTVFATEQTASLPFPVLTSALRQIVKCSDMSARCYVKSSSLVCLVRQVDNGRYNVFLRDAEHPETSQEIVRRNKTKTQRVIIREEIIKILRSATGSEMQGAALVKRVSLNTRLPRTTVYVVLGKMRSSVERIAEAKTIKYKLRPEASDAA